MVRYLLIAVLIALGAYGLIEARGLILGPSLSIAAPQSGAAVPDGIVVVEGRAARSVMLTLNGAGVLPDQEGRFSSTLALPRGGSILTLSATDRFGRSITRTRTVFVP